MNHQSPPYRFNGITESEPLPSLAPIPIMLHIPLFYTTGGAFPLINACPRGIRRSR